MKIVPAILAENFNDFLFRLRQAESFADYAQIDLMDGYFVPSVSFPGERLSGIETSLPFEIHLMVKHPSAYMSTIDNPNLERVIFHFESDVKHSIFINQIKERGLKIGMAIKPETEIEEFREAAKGVDTLLFLTVNPGFYGSPFEPEVVEKIKRARQIFGDKQISADGGVSLENLGLFIEAGVDYVCVGSRIFLGENPGENYKNFVRKLTEIEVNK